MSDSTAYPPLPPLQLPPPPAPAPRSRRTRTIIIVVSVLAALLVAGLVRWGLTTLLAGPSRQQSINSSVTLIKAESHLPKTVDSVTTWTDVKAEPNAIHYLYTISAAVKPGQLTVKSIRDVVLPGLCSTKSTRRILDDGIAMRYSYTLAGSATPIDTTFTKADC